jgi:hypothetical protein
MAKGLEIGLIVPDLWQQEAVRALREGKDVVVQAPTGSGKTYIFELLYSTLKEQAVFTVPTRALANDKLGEWRSRGWDVGIATGDLALNLDARVVVATLETQRTRFLRREGPRLLVVDEYQMIADPVRGVHYELALALAPPQTQLLLLSGSVQNPQDVVSWLQRIGRDAVLIQHRERPVPLEEVDLQRLPDSQFVDSRNPWARTIGKTLRADLTPVLLFAPRRKASEEMAQAIGSALPQRDPLPLSPAQEALAGKQLAKLLRNRVAYHHSGLSYAVRAGLIEPLAKAGQLNAVVATMGLAAGINFSMRSVLVTDTRYMAGNFQRQVQQDELLQMFGRAGRRGLDETGYVLFQPNVPRLGDARARQLKRGAQVDWPSFISVMRSAAERGEPPFAAAVQLSHSLFSPHPVAIGAEHSLVTGPRPCGLSIDAERARFVRRPITEILNSKEEWETKPLATTAALGKTFIREKERWIPALTLPRMLDGRGFGNLCKLTEKKIYGREIPLATVIGENEIAPVKWLRNKLRSVAAVSDGRTIACSRPALSGRGAKAGDEAVGASRATEPRGDKKCDGQRPPLQQEDFDEMVQQLLPQWLCGGKVSTLVRRGETISARIDFSNIEIAAQIDSHGVALHKPPEREALPPVCRECDQLEHDRAVVIVASPAYAWHHLGLIESDGTPTRRGIVFSFFQAGEGLAIAAALEDETYPIEDLVFDLANIRAGPRFAGEEALLGGRLGILCQKVYHRADYPGYLEMGAPMHYGSGASEVMRELCQNPAARSRLTNDALRLGDIERALMEWRSLLRHIVAAPNLEWDRWQQLQSAAAHYIENTKSPTVLDLPPLLPSQQRR